MPTSTPTENSFAAAWAEWHAAHERHRADPYGFLAVTHLHWLGAEPARGTPAYAPDPAFAVEGTFVPFDEPRATTVGAAVEGIQHMYEGPGEIRFRLGDSDLVLTAFNGHTPGSLSVLFTDRTSGRTTYAANRSLSVAAPGTDGTVTLDFNRAVNLPCAYTDLATCPLPPAENRLPVAIEAGEQIPYERQDAS